MNKFNTDESIGNSVSHNGIDLEDAYIAYSKQNGIDFNYIMNTTCHGTLSNIELNKILHKQIELLKKAGIEYVIIGHSERRIKLNETPDIINKKLFAALKNKLKVILCVGETKTEKDCGTEKSAILNQINSAVCGLKEIEEELENIVIAYEPVWAIGNTNANVDPIYAENMCAFIKDFININFRKKINVLYGGSLNSKNAEIFLKMENIDGGLIGGASLDIKEFSEIIKISQNLYIS